MSAATNEEAARRNRDILTALTLCFIVLGGLVLSGCGTTASEPKGIGTGPDALKESPCACTEIPMAPIS